MEVAEPIPNFADGLSVKNAMISASPWLVLLVLAMGEFMILLDTTIVAVAIPKLSGDIGASLDQLLWVLNAYTLVFAVLLITAGRLGDMFGSKKLFLLGLFVFTAASAACGLAQSANQLIVFRVIQALGGATLMPQTLSIITYIFPVEKRGAAFGIWSAIAGLAAAVGPTLGGVLTTAFSWRAVFFPNIPIGLAALVLAFLMMPELTIQRKRRIDIPGVFLATLGLTGLIFGLVEGQKYGWGRISSIAKFDIGPLHAGLLSIPSVFLASAIVLALFVNHEAHHPEPLLPLSLFSDRNYSVGSIIAFVVNFAILGLFFPIILFLQSVLGLSAVNGGFALLPVALGSIITAPVAGRLVYKINGKMLLFVGLIMFATGIALTAFVASLSAHGITFTLPLFIAGLGMGLTLAPMTALAMRNITPAAAGAASGFINTIRQVGAAMGSAVVGAVLENRLATELNTQAVHFSAQLAPPMDKFRTVFIDGVSKLSSGGLAVGVGQAQMKLPTDLTPAQAHQIQHLGTLVFNTAFLNAMKLSEFVPVPLLLLGALIALIMRSPRAATVSKGAPGTDAATPQIAPALRVAAPIGISDTLILSSALPMRLEPTRLMRPAGQPFLVQEGGSQAARYAVKDTVSIGRSPNNTVVLRDPKASRHHAEVMLLGGHGVVRDLGSLNGTTVNGEMISGERLLQENDVIKIGDARFVYRQEPAA